MDHDYARCLTILDSIQDASSETESRCKTTQDRTFSCDSCGKTLRSKESFKRHQHTHDKDWPFSCSACGRGFIYEYRLKRHALNHVAQKIECELCGKKYMPNSLRAHMLLHQGIKPKNIHNLPCEHCSRTFSNKSVLEAHVATHTGEKNHQCPVCRKNFSAKIYLNIHVKRHSLKHPDDDKVSCNICSKMLKPGSLRMHMNAHWGVKFQRKHKFFCEICDKGFFVKGQLDAHVPRHSSEWNYKCDTCGKKYASLIHLKSHLKYHGPRLCVCEFCGGRFPSQREVKTHLKLVHEQFKAFKCEYCPKSFGFRFLLKQHTLIHTDGPQYKCRLCHKAYKLKYNLEAHVTNIHTNNRPFFCKVCSRAFGTKMQYYFHVKREHKPKTEVKCEICQKVFPFKFNFQVHLKSKDHEKNFLSATSEEQEKFLFT